MSRKFGAILCLLHWQKYKWLFQNTDIDRGLFTYLNAQDTFVSQTLSTSDRAISSHDIYRHSNPRRKDFLAPCSVTLMLPQLDSESWGTGELWSKTILLKWQN